MRRFLTYLISFVSGAAVLCLFSAFQKQVIGAPLVWKGFIIPFLFGGLSGLVIGFYRRRMKKITDELRRSRDRLKMLVKERTAELEADIRKRQEVEQSLSESEEYFRGIFETSPIGVTIVDTKDQKILEANESFQKLIGYRSDELQNMTVKDITHPEDWENEIQTIQQQLENVEIDKGQGVDFNLQKRYIHKNGNPIWVRVSGDVLHLTGRTFPLAVACAMDITDWKRAKEALERSEREKRIILNSLNNTAIEYIDSDMRLIWCGDSVLEYVDASCEQLVGNYCYQMLYNRDAPCEDCSAFRALETGEIQVMEKKTEDGRFWTVQSIPIEHEPGKVEAVVYFGFDITRMKRAEEQRGRADERFRAFVENANDIVFSVAPDGVFTYISPNWKNMLGHEPSDVVGTHFGDYVHPEDVWACQNILEKVLSSGKKQGLVQYRVKHLDGRWLWHTTNGSIITDQETGSPVFMGIARDITKIKDVEEKLRNSETKYRTLFESSHDALLIMSPETFQFISANTTAIKMFGFKNESDLIAKTPIDLSPLQQEDGSDSSEKAKEWIAQALEDGSVFFEWSHQRANGQIFPATVLLNRYEIHGEIMLQSTLRDITEQKKAESQRLLMERRIMKIQHLERLGIMAGGIAHDFNNILMIVLGNIEFVKDGMEPNCYERHNLEEAEKATQRAVALVRQILAYSGKGHFNATRLNLNEVITETRSALKTAIPENIELNIKMEDSLPLIQGDSDRLKQIAMSLVLNAAESYNTNPGAVQITTGLMFCSETYLMRTVSEVWIAYDEPILEGNYVYLEVTDYGCGMDRETLKRVFDPFFSTKFLGRGLGLSTVLGIVRGHNGFIHVESTPKKGSVFRILFPPAKENHLKAREK